MLKKIIFILVFGLTLIQPLTASATELLTEDEIKGKVSDILPEGVVHETRSEGLPTGDLKKEIVPQLIRLILMLAGTISFAVFVYAGVMLIYAQGNEEEITKFKNIIIWSLVGLAFVAASYAIVSGVLKIQFT